MKKFRFAAGLMSLAMLGACSSDNPEIVGNDNNGDEKGVYIAINLASDASREADPNEKDGENEHLIENVQLILKNGNETFLNVNSEVVTGQVAKFKVHAPTYNKLKELQPNTTFDIYVYANGIDVTEAQLLTGKSDNIRKTNSEASGGQPFIMSNASKVSTTLEALEETENEGTLANPWVISQTIKLARLAARFDYVEKNGNNYTLSSDQNVTMHVAAMAVRTFAENTYRLPQFSKDGTTTGMVAFGGGENIYPVTDTFGYASEDATGRRKLSALDYQIRVPGYENDTYKKSYCYARPNTITKDQTASFLIAPYVGIRAEFIPQNCELTMAKIAAGEQPHLYAIDGILIGGMAELKKLKDENGTFKVETTLTETEDLNKIKAVEDAVASILERFDLVNEANLDEQIESLKGQVYKPSANGKFYTYYAEMIVTRTDAQCESAALPKKDALKYGVLRNSLYSLSVNSFKWLGNNGDFYPGEDPGDSEIEDMAISFSLDVNKWKVIPAANNTWDL